MDDSLVKELQEIGLSEKEAKVYLASLELGPATAQQIAAKALVNRPTTYIMIESLEKRGLMSSYKKGKRKVFSASNPAVLNYLLANEKRQLEKRQEKFSAIIEKIKNNTDVGCNDEITVTLQKGLDAVIYHQDLMLETDNEDATDFLEVVNLDKAKMVFPNRKPETDIRNEINDKYKFKCLVKGKNGTSAQFPNGHRKVIKDENDNIEAALNIHGDHAVFSVYDSKEPQLLIINNSAITKTLRTLFTALWNKTK